jgi:(1->4)-alpha-D-glucan 1-alpha-D-glucosylmutase
MIRVPRSTYRLQLHADFGFRDAAHVVPYLARLGISEPYLSPVFKAAPRSTHGYDVLDHDTLSPTSAAPRLSTSSRLPLEDTGSVSRLISCKHMGVGCDGNRYWDDVLKHGRASPFASYFDIDWHSRRATLEGKLLLPILPDQYGVCLERGELNLLWESTTFWLQVTDRKLPVRPKSQSMIWTDSLAYSKRIFQSLDARCEPARPGFEA